MVSALDFQSEGWGSKVIVNPAFHVTHYFKNVMLMVDCAVALCGNWMKSLHNETHEDWRQADRQADGQTDGQTGGRQTSRLTD